MSTIISEQAAEEVLSRFEERIDELKQNGLYRHFLPCARLAAEPGHAMYDGKKIQVWCTNDYLGLSQHPEVIGAQLESTRRHGTGTGGSRNIAGTSTAHVELETRLASWHGKQRALIFNSGYTANVECLSTLTKAVPDLLVFSDALNHRSLIEGLRRQSAAKHIYPHNDVVALETLLDQHGRDRPTLIVFESVYSMDGDISPITEICDLAERYGAMTFVDETHAIGTHGETGAGVCEEVGERRATFIQGVFGKAMGTTGGYVAGPNAVLDYVRSSAPGFIFTTSIPHASLDATLASLDIVQQGDDLRRALFANVRQLKRSLSEAEIDYLEGTSHLVLVPVPGAERVRRVSKRLLKEFAIYVQPINFPSVPRGGERFRITVSPFRTSEEISYFVQALQACLYS